MIITPAVTEISAALFDRFAGLVVSWGIYNRRPIAGTLTWSQHSWGNAEDISNAAGTSRMSTLDSVYRWMVAERSAGRLPLGTILWRVRDHYDHIHYEGLPKQFGTPPLSGVTKMDVIAELGAVGRWVAPFQVALNEAKVRNGGAWPTLVIDGRYGADTKAAVHGYQAAAGLIGITGTVAGVLDSRTAILLAEFMRPDA
jgi:hypothetical protein